MFVCTYNAYILRIAKYHIWLPTSLMIGFNYVYTRVSVYEHVHMRANTHEGQRRRIALELELQMIVRCLKWVLGTEIHSLARKVHPLPLGNAHLLPAFLCC